MFRKYAVAEVLSAEMVVPGQRSLKRQAHRAAFNYEPREGYLYVRSRAISSRCNDNYDEFPADEIKEAYRTFVGKPVFVNHNNDNHRRARGVVIDAALHEDTNPDGSPDTWCEVLMEVDAAKFPKLAKAILAGHVDRTSMGTDVAFSICSVCNNKATTPLEYCQHIPAMKGKRIFRTTASGTREGILVREICHGLKFFENSLLVEEPADPTAYTFGVELGPDTKLASRKQAGSSWDEMPTIAPPKFNVGDRVQDFRGEGATVHRVYPSNRPGKSHRVQVRWDDPDRNLTWDGKQDPEGAGDQRAYYEHVFNHHPDSYGAAERRVNDAFKDLPDMSRFYSKQAAAEDQHRVPPMLRDIGQNVFRRAMLMGHEPRALTDGTNLEIGCRHCHTTSTINRNGHIGELFGVHNSACNFNPNSGTYGDRQAPEGVEPMGPLGLSDRPVRSLNSRTASPFGGGGAGRKTTNTCKVCGGPIFKLEGAAGMAHAWQHDDDNGAGMPHHAEPVSDSEGHEEVGKEGSLDIADFFKQAYGETMAPADVDTLRDAECPVCGESDAFDGSQCQVCGYVAPPAMFRDPDLDMAKNLDLRKDVLDDAQADPNGDGIPDQVPGSAVPGTDQVPGQTTGDTGLPEQLEPDPMDGSDDASGQFGEAEGVNPEGEDGSQAEGLTPSTTLVCPNCSFEAPAAQPQSVNTADPTAPPADSMEAGQGGDGLMDGDVCPNCGQAQMVPLAAAQQQSQQQPQQPQGQQPVGAPNSPPKGRGTGFNASLDGRGRAAQKGQSMRPALAALAAQQKIIEGQHREIGILRRQLDFVANMAGVSQHLAAIRRQADINNPAEPIPDPPSEQAFESTEQAVTPETNDNVQNPGMTPGSVQKLPADATTTPMVPGTTIDTGPFNQLLDVTAPTSGTETQLPLEQTKIQTDIRVGDPMNPQIAYPWTIGQSAAANGEAAPVMGEANRTMAAMHLARLRIQSGIAAGDDLAVGTEIDGSNMPTEAMLHEINTLSAVTKAAAKRPQNVGRPAGRPANLVPRTASQGVQRTMPSMTGDPVMAHVASAGEDDTADADLFLGDFD